MKNILVLCTGNSCRSQMAHGYLHQILGDKATIYSAGIETHGINPGAALAMKKDGIDISNHTSNNVNEYQEIDCITLSQFVIMPLKTALTLRRLMQKDCIIIFMTRQNLLAMRNKPKLHL